MKISQCKNAIPIIIVLFGLYYFRIDLVKFVLNTIFDEHQIELVALHGLELDSESISIGSVDLVLGNNRSKQRFEDLTLNYSITLFRFTNLRIHFASLSIPEFISSVHSPKDVILSELLSQFADIPLKSITIELLKFLGQDVHVEWQKIGREQLLYINDTKVQSKLKLTHQNDVDSQIEWLLQTKNNAIVNTHLDLQKLGETYKLTGTNFVHIDPLFRLLKPFIAKWPDNIQKIKGTLVFDLQTVLKDKLRLFDRRLPDMSLQLDGKLLLNSLTTQDYKIQKLNANLKGQLSIGQTQVSLKLSPNELLKTHSIETPSLIVKNFKIQTETDSKINYELDSGKLQLDQKQLYVDLTQVKTSQAKLSARIHVRDIRIVHTGHTNAYLRLNTNKINLQIPGQWLPTFGLRSTVKLKKQHLSLNGHLTSEIQKKLFDFSAHHNLSKQKGAGHISINMQFGPHTNKMSQYFSSWPFAWDLQDGQFKATTDFNWQQSDHGFKILSTVEQSFSQLSGYYHDIVFIGMDSTFLGEYKPTNLLVSTKPGKLSIQKLDIGLPVENIQSSFSIDSSRNLLAIHTFDAQLLGGKILVRDFAYQPEITQNPLLLNVQRIQLTELLSLGAFNTVYAQGAISGKLPITLYTQGISMEHGRLAAEKPGGVIRYQPDPSAKITATTNPNLQLAVDALSNYHFDTLQADAQYSANGDLTLQMKMQGLNPDMNNGQRINLNLNVSDNIPTLLRSLQSGRIVADVLERKLIQ